MADSRRFWNKMIVIVLVINRAGRDVYEILAERDSEYSPLYWVPQERRCHGNRSRRLVTWRKRQTSTSCFSCFLAWAKNCLAVASTRLYSRCKFVWLRRFWYPKKGSWWASASQYRLTSRIHRERNYIRECEWVLWLSESWYKARTGM